MAQKPRRSYPSRPHKRKILACLRSEEVADLLRTLLEKHPELIAESEDLARARVTVVDADAVAADVEQAVLGLDYHDLNTRAGLVLGLYRCRSKNADQVLGWVPDFLAETAGHAVEMLAHESAARHRRIWRLADAVLDQAPEWTAMMKRA